MSELLLPEKILKKIIVAVICIVVVIYVTRQIVNLVNSNIETEIALAVTSEEALELEGYIMRDEIVLTSTRNGIMISTVDDGQRIAKGRDAVRVYSAENDYSIDADMRSLDKKIDILEKSMVDTAYISADMKKMDEEIAELLSNYFVYNANNDLYTALSHKEDLLVTMNRRWMITNPGKSFKGRIDELTSQRDAYKDRLLDKYDGIKADEAGYYYSSVDGYENIFSSEKLRDLTLASFDEMVSSAPENYSGNVAGKIATDYMWYVVCPVSREQAYNFDEGKTYSIEYTYNFGTVLDMKLRSKITDNDSDRALLVFESGEVPEDFDFARNQKVRVVYKKYSGLKVPKEAVRVVNDIKGVYVVNGTEVEFKRISEIYSFDDYYIIEKDPESALYSKKYVRKTTKDEQGNEKNEYYRVLSLYDQVIVKGKDIYDGMKVE